MSSYLPSTVPSSYRSVAGARARRTASFPFSGYTTDGVGKATVAELTDLTTLSEPFPHTDAFNPADDLPDPPGEADFDSKEKFNEAEDAHWQQHEAVVFSPEHSIGLLYLCHLGCAYREALVISGPARGQMWGDDTASDRGFLPLHEPDGRPTGFTRWYRGWLEQAEEQTQSRWSRNAL